MRVFMLYKINLYLRGNFFTCPIEEGWRLLLKTVLPYTPKALLTKGVFLVFVKKKIVMGA